MSRGRLMIMVGVALAGVGLGLPVANAQKIYWIMSWHTIMRADLDGSNPEIVLTGLHSVMDIAIDPAGGKMYWTNPGAGKIQRANLDGSQVEDLVTSGLDDPCGIAVDPVGAKVYWANRLAHKIQRANLDGSAVEDLVTIETGGPRGVALDLTAGKVYWAATVARKIQRANLDGSKVEDVVTISYPSLYPIAIALDAEGGKMYWTLDDLSWGSFGVIQRANLDGSGIEDVYVPDFPGEDAPQWIALDAQTETMYWTKFTFPDGVRRANLDGSAVEDLIETHQPRGIALDLRVAGDCDGDSEVTLKDLVWLVDCITGPGATPRPECHCVDLNYDGYVDLGDFALFQIALTAP